MTTTLRLSVDVLIFGLFTSAAQLQAFQAPTASAQADAAAELMRATAAQRHLAQFNKYVSLSETPAGSVPLQVLNAGGSSWPSRIDLDPLSQLRVEASFAAESAVALADAGIREVCLRISADGQPSIYVPVTTGRPASATLASAFAAAKALVFEVEVRSCQSPPTPTLAEISLAIRDRSKVAALASVTPYTFHEVRSPGWKPTSGSLPPEVLLEDDGFSLLVDKKSTIQIRARTEDPVLDQLRAADVSSLCIEASWPNSKDGSKTDTGQIEVHIGASVPASATPPFVNVDGRASSYSLTLVAREGSCKTASPDSLSKRNYRVDLADLGLQLLPPIISDAVLFGWTSLPDTERPISVKRNEQIAKVGVNVFLWGDRFRKRDSNKVTRALRRSIGFNVTPGITVAGPKIASGGQQTAVSLGIVIAEPTTRAAFIGFGRLSFGPYIKNRGMIFVGVSGVELVKRIRGLP